jgi:hypothetical protein
MVGNWNTIDGVIRVAFGDGADTMYRAHAFVTHTGYSNAPYCKVGGADFNHAAAVARGIIQTDDVSHDRGLS